MNVISAFVPNFIGGAADVVGSTKTYLKGKDDYGVDNYRGKNIAFDVREHAMGAILNGMALSHLRVFGSCFLAFADYMKPAIRNCAMMNLPVTYIFTHDSILVGKDGATHQPVEQLAMLRSIPNLSVYRPSDYKELIGSWNEILSLGRPSALILPRGHVAVQEFTNPAGIEYGGYIISEVKKSLDVILIATGSEVSLAIEAQKELLKQGHDVRVVSMPSMELFDAQTAEYKETVLPSSMRKRLAVEMATEFGWHKYLGLDGRMLSVNQFGSSAPANKVIEEYGFTVENVVKTYLSM